MNLLVTVDENYLNPLRVMLCSFFANNPQEKKTAVYLLHGGIPAKQLVELVEYLKSFDAHLVPLEIPEEYFVNEATSSRYPKEMYYRLLCPLVLPESVDRILYLDPDILIINPLDDLYHADLQGKAFAAASHVGLTDMTSEINSLRLGTEQDYFNTGVILFDLDQARKIVRASSVFDTVRKFEHLLILPDQDVFNILYGEQTMQVDDLYWNYDARKFSLYLVRTSGQASLRYVIENVSVLHFCGKHKPWQPETRNPFLPLYVHYMKITDRVLESIGQHHPFL